MFKPRAGPVAPQRPTPQDPKSRSSGREPEEGSVRTSTSVVWLGAAVAAAAQVVGCQTAPSPVAADSALREYAGAYEWADTRSFVYLQIWNELTGKNQLVGFDESGEVRVMSPAGRDQFSAGASAAVPSHVQSRVAFQRDASGKIVSLSWQREGGAGRAARRMNERHDDVTFTNGNVRLAGTLVAPAPPGRHPVAILVHGSGPATREQILPFARFLVRRGMAVLAYDKRGVGGSSGDWTTASFDDLASDAVAAFSYLKTRPDVDSAHIGMIGVSQAGWIMPLAAVREPRMAFLVSVSGAGVPVEETVMDHSRNEMLANGMRPEVVAQIQEVMKLQHAYARTGEGWDAYMAARDRLAARFGRPPDSYPGTRDHSSWGVMRRIYFYDPAPTLRKLRTPTLALFGELDNNIVAAKNRAAWERALREGGHTDYSLVVLPKANHYLLEARVGNNAEVPTLSRWVPAYFATVEQWLARHVSGLAPR
jgi:uncharacterized protein